MHQCWFFCRIYCVGRFQRCPLNYFGPNCNQPCPAKCNNSNCHIDTGECFGCKDGYRGPKCREECQNNMYGAGCSKECGHCVGGEQCNPVHGTCHNGCEAGYYKRRCKRECNDSTYGSNCSYSCGHCQDEDPCDKKTGKCPSGCASGYEGIYCKKRCEHKYYGSNCNLTCSTTCINQTCDAESGICVMSLPYGEIYPCTIGKLNVNVSKNRFKATFPCNAGIGRTGTYIALDSLYHAGKKSGRVNVAEYVKTMRANRMNMIQTYEKTRDVTIAEPKSDLKTQNVKDTFSLRSLVSFALSCPDEGPIIVVSKDGASMCGVFCAVFNSIQQITMDDNIDVFTTVRQLQTRRPEFCSTQDEYGLIYQTVYDHLIAASDNVYYNQ
uniref:Endothelial cells scavenger receptor n=1 Tax=Magallana gigas TaxID=29159 RepID=K1Q1G7_MAGGI